MSLLNPKIKQNKTKQPDQQRKWKVLETTTVSGLLRQMSKDRTLYFIDYSFYKNYSFYFLWLSALHAGVCPHMCAQCCEGQKRASRSLELEMWMVVDHYVGAGNWTLLCKSNQRSYPLSPCSSPLCIIFEKRWQGGKGGWHWTPSCNRF